MICNPTSVRCDVHYISALRCGPRRRFAVQGRTADDGCSPMPKEARPERLTVRMSAALKRAVEDLADRDNRSVSDWICLRLAEVVKAEAARAAAAKTKR